MHDPLVILGSGGRLPFSMRANTRYSILYCAASGFLDIVFVLSHPVMSTKCPCVSPASGERKQRKSITPEMKLKIMYNLDNLEI